MPPRLCAGERLLRAPERRAVDGDQDIARLQAGLLRGAAHIEVSARERASRGSPSCGACASVTSSGNDADPTANDSTARDDVVENTAHEVDGRVLSSMPSTPRFLATMAVLIPTSAPLVSIRAPGLSSFRS